MTRRITLSRVGNYASVEGIGSLYVFGRWHTKGHPVVYCSEDPSTALLETLVHIEIDNEDRPETFQVLKIESAKQVSIRERRVVQVNGLYRHRFLIGPAIVKVVLSLLSQGLQSGWVSRWRRLRESFGEGNKANNAQPSNGVFALSPQ